MKSLPTKHGFPHQFQSLLLAWYDKHGRHDLPWKKKPTPYRVWVSEIMLQQTQVQTVKPYYQRFMKSFPNIKTLASASLDDVMQHWSGLGYYRRARFIYEAANRVHFDFRGRFPSELSQLMALPGIGQSTAGAIRTMAFNQPAAILDGNVKRLFARLCLIDDVPPYKNLWQKAHELMCQTRPADYTQALMDMGANICTRSKPKCLKCPLKSICKAYQHQKQHLYPRTKQRKQKRLETKQFFVLQYRDKIMLEKRASQGIWANLWCFPESPQHKQLAYTKLPSHRHTLTHVTFQIEPYFAKLQRPISPPPNYRWQKLSQISQLAIPKPVQSILQLLP